MANAKPLSYDDYTTITRSERVPAPVPQTVTSRFCASCVMGEHLCTGVSCWGCHCGRHG